VLTNSLRAEDAVVHGNIADLPLPEFGGDLSVRTERIAANPFGFVSHSESVNLEEYYLSELL